MKQKGFTVIELLVVGAIGAVLLSVVLYILTSSAKMASKARLNRIIDDQAAFLMFELKKNLMSARLDTVVCSDSHDQVTFNNRFDNHQTVIVCADNKVASNSATMLPLPTFYDLTSGEVSVGGCDSFVSCDGSNINFSFTLTAGVNAERPEDLTFKSFSTAVTVRQ